MAKDTTDRDRRRKRKEMDLDGDGNITPQERQIWKATQPDEVSRAELADTYGYALNVIFSNPELKRLFLRAFNDKKGQWTAQKFLAELKNTDWWKNGKYWRQAWVTEKEGVEWEDQFNAASQVVSRRATAVGVNLSDRQLRRLTRRYLYEGWYEGPRAAFLDNALADFITNPNAGDEATVGNEDYEAQLRALAWDYGVEKLLDDAWYASARQKIINGSATFEDLTAQIREKAKSKYAPLAGAIDNGETTRSALKGYTSSMADLLELDESKVDLDDPLLRKAWTTQNGPDGKPTTMTIYDFETSVRRDPRWKQTKNGRQTTLGVADSFLQSLGLRR